MMKCHVPSYEQILRMDTLYTLTAEHPKKSKPEVWRNVHRNDISRVIDSFVRSDALSLKIEVEGTEIDAYERDTESANDSLD